MKKEEKTPMKSPIRKVIKWIGYTLGGLAVGLLVIYLVCYIRWSIASANNLKALGKEARQLSVDGYTFRDLNKNDKLDAYEDNRVPIEDRVTDLLSQMRVEEKVGLLYVYMIAMEKNGDLIEVPSITNPVGMLLESASELIVNKKMNHFNLLDTPGALATARWNNHIQKMAERTRLGIPITIASDPRHGSSVAGQSVGSMFYSRWPSQLGMGATRDAALVREFGDIARQEYLAIGIRLALHPMADLATEPRWSRLNNTFGEDAQLAAKLTEAYILGFQGDSLSSSSVACMTKHFSGGGPQEDGWDAHFANGKGQVYPGNNFGYHVIPFTEGAFKAKTAQIMPYYGIPRGQTSEEVAFAFNKDIITDLLRDSLKFDGVVCTDWGVVTDMPVKEASAWGVEHLSTKERTRKVIEAGCDMLGGEISTELLLTLVQEGAISEIRLNESVRRVLRDKFRLGLFDNPYVDEESVNMVGNPVFVARGKEAQRKALVLLKNEGVLPLQAHHKIFVEGFSREIGGKHPQIVGDIEDADFVVQKLETPYTPANGGGLLERFSKQGRLHFDESEKSVILERTYSKPTITILEMDSPPIVPAINKASKAMIATFGCEEDVLLELVFGKFKPTGKLPIEIPSSIEAVENQMEDVPYDSKAPLYPYGHGLSYQETAYD
ncbi:MAG: glycoside hydrolase family 3 N-terminal domain-containing protein [Bacteroidota bacterium]